MIAFAEVAIGSGGFTRCCRCSPSQALGQPAALDEVAAALASVARAWSGGPGPNVTFIGFEPFSHPALPRLIEAATSQGFERIRLRTDGGALAQPGNAAGAFAAGVRHIEITLLGASELHDRLTGRPGLSSTVGTGVRAFEDAAEQASAAVSVTVHLPVCRHNVAGLAEAVATAARLGAVAVTLDAGGLPASDGNRALLAAALETATVNRVAAHVEGWAAEAPAFSSTYDRAPWQDMSAS